MFYSYCTDTSAAKGRYFPVCRCEVDGVGFICNDEGYENPPGFEVVTHDKLQDISGSNEHDFYLNTNDKYRLHRYDADEHVNRSSR